MSTAIVRAQTSDGFIIAADGRETNFTTEEVLTECRQKIFQIGRSPAAYCATGATLLGDLSDNLDNVRFDFGFHLKTHTADIHTSDLDSMDEVAKRVCLPIYEKLRKVCGETDVDLPRGLGGVGRGETILAVFFDGYVMDTIPSRAIVRFFHEDRAIGEPEFMNETPGVAYYGSDIVFREMRARNTFDRFKASIPAQSVQESSVLNQEIAASLYYLRSCSSAEARAVDPKCMGIGGHIHIARITPRVGFRWIKGFAPIEVS